MRRGSLLAEHLGALAVIAMVVLWVVVLNDAYQTQVVALQRQVQARYAARTALQLAAPGQTGLQEIALGQRQWQVRIDAGQVVVTEEGGGRYVFTPGADDD